MSVTVYVRSALPLFRAPEFLLGIGVSSSLFCGYAAFLAVGAAVAQSLQSGAIPQVSTLPESVRVIVEDIYAQSIAHSFLIAVPVAVVSLIAIVFLPNRPLTRMTTTERVAASEADLATVSVPAAMATLSATGTVRTQDAAGSRRAHRDAEMGEDG